MDPFVEHLSFLVTRGLAGTLGLAGLASIFSIIVAAGLALVRIGPFRPLRLLARVQVDVFRSIPLMALLIFMFFALGPLASKVGITSFGLAVIALTLSESSYLSEVYRGALLSISPTQWEAARSLGFGWRGTVRLIVLPQAVLPSIPASVNLLIGVIKDSALASLIAVGELTQTATIRTSMTFKPMEVYTAVAVIYLAITIPLTLVAAQSERFVERRYGLRVRTGGLAPEMMPPNEEVSAISPVEDFQR